MGSLSKHTDNLLHVIKGEITFSSTTVISQEIDFDLPRGYIAKIRSRTFKMILMDNFANSDLARFQAALVRDPDDTTTTSIPENSIQHDVVDEAEMAILSDAATNAVVTEVIDHEDYSEEEDVLTARNMRFNGQASGVDGTDYGMQCIIKYTLEKVTDAILMDLLDIL